MGEQATDQTSRLMKRVDHHVDRLITQYNRFEEMADRLRPWAKKWSVDELTRGLDDPESTTHHRERRLVTLALKADARSGAAIEAYDPDDEGRHWLFYRVVRIEWERRYRGDKAGGRAA